MLPRHAWCFARYAGARLNAPTRFRQLTRAGRLGFLVAIAPDLALLSFVVATHGLDTSTLGVTLACLLVWAIRDLAWVLRHVVLGEPHSMAVTSLLTLPLIVLAHLQTDLSWYPIGAGYGTLVLLFVFFLLYPTDWAQPVPGAARRFREALQPADLRTASVFALSPDTDVHHNPLVAPDGPHADEAYWLQEIGNPSDPVVVLCAGMPTSSVGMANLIPALQLLGYFVALVDYPGVGNGRHERFSVHEMRRRVELYLSTLQPQPGTPARLWGVSGGGNMVLWLAAELPELVSAVAAVVAVAPGSPYSYNPQRNVFWHGLTIKTKSDSRITPYAAVSKVVDGIMQATFRNLALTDPAWHENLKLADAMVHDPLTCTAQQYFHDPDLLEREFFSPDGPGGRPGYEAQMRAVSERVLAWMAPKTYLRRMFCPEIYPEYVEEYCRCDMDGALARIVCPVLFFGGKGDPASKSYDSWTEVLPSDTRSEVVMAQIIDSGLGGSASHTHAGIFWRRHTLTVDRFFRSTMQSE